MREQPGRLGDAEALDAELLEADAVERDRASRPRRRAAPGRGGRRRLGGGAEAVARRGWRPARAADGGGGSAAGAEAEVAARARRGLRLGRRCGSGAAAGRSAAGAPPATRAPGSPSASPPARPRRRGARPRGPAPRPRRRCRGAPAAVWSRSSSSALSAASALRLGGALFRGFRPLLDFGQAPLGLGHRALALLAPALQVLLGVHQARRHAAADAMLWVVWPVSLGSTPGAGFALALLGLGDPALGLGPDPALLVLDLGDLVVDPLFGGRGIVGGLGGAGLKRRRDRRHGHRRGCGRAGAAAPAAAAAAAEAAGTGPASGTAAGGAAWPG